MHVLISVPMQVDASLQNQNLPWDLWWMAKWIHKLQKVINFRHIQMTCDQLVLICIGWPNSEKIVLTCVRIWAQQSQCKSSQANTSGWPNVTQVEQNSKVCVDLHWLLSLFGQGLSFTVSVILILIISIIYNYTYTASTRFSSVALPFLTSAAATQGPILDYHLCCLQMLSAQQCFYNALCYYPLTSIIQISFGQKCKKMNYL